MIRTSNNIILVSAPWPLYNRPSIQLGSLKAYLNSYFSDLHVDTRHFYLQIAASIGYPLYQAISEKTWLAETVFSALSYPDRLDPIKKLYHREATGKPVLKNITFESLTHSIQKISDDFIKNIEWNDFSLAGFSICLCQLTSSLYLIRRIKQYAPHLPIVVGGSTLSGDNSPNLLKQFPEIDFIIRGEGERPLTELFEHLISNPGWKKLPFIRGLDVPEKMQGGGTPSRFSQLASLSKLPPPDYDDYFKMLKTLKPGKHFFPMLPVEISRGCWWQQKKGKGNISGCAFCNLNLQWHGFRSKKAEQAVAEIDQLTNRYKTVSLAITDNVLPVKGGDKFFSGLRRLKKDFRIFSEIRATTSRKKLQMMKSAGMADTQVGIEALSSSLLDKINKGTTAIQNLEVMKNCEEVGIRNVSNLMLCFPGSDQQDVDETLKNMDFAVYFRPLKPVTFWLGLGSPVWRNPGVFGIKTVENHHNYKHLFPAAVCDTNRFMIQNYRGDRVHQQKLWRPVKSALIRWQKRYDRLHSGPNHVPILSYRDGREILIIRLRETGNRHQTHRLTGTSRKIYIYCRKHRPLRKIINRFPDFNATDIKGFLKEMAAKKLMFEENDNYLSLAVARKERTVVP